ncbi:MAG: P22 coat - protein 5 family protein, partial [Deltaproteobacteria bacterium]|nr:P22 coat - protein 5 family protein [Deltaproteobacteria bacterium]
MSREMAGLTRAVSLFPGAERAALNQTISYPIVPAYSTSNITPAATGPDPSATTVAAGTLSISKSKGVPFFWEGDEQLSLAGGYNPIFQAQVAQAMRALVNEMEGDIAGLHVNASRAIGTAGTTPFASSLADTSALRKVLSDNGAPLNDLQLVVNTDAGQAIRDLTQLQN